MRKKEGFLINAGPSMMILVLLRERERHGVELARELERRSSAHLVFQPGTLYPLLHQLEKQGHVQSQWEHPEGERARRVYSLTEKGRTEAEHQVSAWSRYAEAVHNVIHDPAPQEHAWIADLFGGRA